MTSAPEAHEVPTPIMVRVREAINEGFRLAGMAYEMPVTLKYHRVNTYHYKSILPVVPPEEMEAQGKRGAGRGEAATCHGPALGIMGF